MTLDFINMEGRLDAAQVGQTVRTALDGTIVTRYTENDTEHDNEYDVRVRLPREALTSPESLGSLALFPGNDQPIYLRDVAEVRLGTGPATIGEVSAEVRAALADLPLPKGYSLIYGGEEESLKENQRNLNTVILLAILFSIPMALIGVGLTLWLTGTPWSAPVLLGLILLAGIVVNNTILLVQYVEMAWREKGLPVEQAVVGGK